MFLLDLQFIVIRIKQNWPAQSWNYSLILNWNPKLQHRVMSVVMRRCDSLWLQLHSIKSDSSLCLWIINVSAPELWHVGDEAFKHFPSSQTSGCCCFICTGLNFCRCYLPLLSTWWCHRHVDSRPVQTELCWSITFSFYPVLNGFRREQCPPLDVWTRCSVWVYLGSTLTETELQTHTLQQKPESPERRCRLWHAHVLGVTQSLSRTVSRTPQSVGSVCSWMLLMGLELFSSTLISSKKTNKKKTCG